MSYRVSAFAILTLAILGGAGNAKAGSASNATITQITYYGTQSGVVLIWTNQVDSGKPSCAQGTWQNTFAINSATSGGAAAIAALIAAEGQGQLVNIAGSGTCTNTGTSEDLEYVTVVQ